MKKLKTQKLPEQRSTQKYQRMLVCIILTAFIKEQSTLPITEKALALFNR